MQKNLIKVFLYQNLNVENNNRLDIFLLKSSFHILSYVNNLNRTLDKTKMLKASFFHDTKIANHNRNDKENTEEIVKKL